ncbi:amine oxidase [Mycolicibacterium sphagni]|uniref:Amine oxidase n=2 Tax=Mycolicibacterium sphagni TaxID=1786 RepID=A0A255DJA0_9MYCO|nr:FAD-dependent oxidoreductase [Mycolicibacterium sphagni]OYN79344.1 amine oxidase [Mycolicibacterium sphagni]
MAGLSAAWRLSEGQWRDRFESITLYQRGWRLGGKGASSRGEHDRIEEHGLHIWLGSYENAFALLRECYAELDREHTDPGCPIRTWDQALVPSEELGMADRFGDDWLIWSGKFSRTPELPGEPGATGRELTVVEFAGRTLRLLLDFAESLSATSGRDLSLSASPTPESADWIAAVRRATLATLAALIEPRTAEAAAAGFLTEALDAVREALDYERRPEHKRMWLLMSLLAATARGLIADRLITDPAGFRAINDEEYSAWLLRHGADADVLDFPLIRGMYDMVFGYEDGDFARPAFAAGIAVLLTGIALFQYKGAFFWKMTAGMGDVIIAPIYQALRRRGVRFEFFHRVDALHLDAHRHCIDAITIGRQVELADGVDTYDPLIPASGLPVFPAVPRYEQLKATTELADTESHFSPRADTETRVLCRGTDFDHVVLAASLGMVELVAAELIADRPEWKEMTAHVRTVATQSFQLWLRPTESALGWHRPGVTTSGYVSPFDTWASMGQTLWAEHWPESDEPQTVAYFCGALDAQWPTTGEPADYVATQRKQVLANAVDYLNRHVGMYLPGAVTEGGFSWGLLAGAGRRQGAAALETQHVSVNVDPSDRYVLSLPGSDKYRLRPDESGYDNLVLAGDWTDSGMNAGCIEAAVISGLQAANALLGYGRYHRIRGFYMP